MRKENKNDTLITKASNGKTRRGIIRKCLKFNTEAPWASTSKQQHSIVGFTLDTEELTIKISIIKGCDPKYEDLFYALLYDRDIRRCIKKVSSEDIGDMSFTGRYKIFEKMGSSGCSDIFISHAHEIDRFISVNTRRVLHISCYGKINESMPKLDIWDFIILSNFLGYHDISNRKQLRKNVKFSYIFPRLIEEFWNDFNSEIPIIL